MSAPTNLVDIARSREPVLIYEGDDLDRLRVAIARTFPESDLSAVRRIVATLNANGSREFRYEG